MKRVIAVLVLLALVVSFASCNKPDSKDLILDKDILENLKKDLDNLELEIPTTTPSSDKVVANPTPELVLKALQDSDYELFSANIIYKDSKNPMFGMNIKNGSNNEILDAWFDGLSFNIVSENEGETVVEITNRDLTGFEEGYAKAVLGGEVSLESYILSVDKYLTSSITIKTIEVEGANKIFVDKDFIYAVLGGMGKMA